MKIINWLLSQLNPMQLIEFLASFVVNLLPGLKTQSLGWLGVLIGIYNVIATPETVAKLCEAGIICLEGNPVWGWITTGFAFLVLVFRKATGLKNGN